MPSRRIHTYGANEHGRARALTLALAMAMAMALALALARTRAPAPAPAPGARCPVPGARGPSVHAPPLARPTGSHQSPDETQSRPFVLNCSKNAG